MYQSNQHYSLSREHAVKGMEISLRLSQQIQERITYSVMKDFDNSEESQDVPKYHSNPNRHYDRPNQAELPEQHSGNGSGCGDDQPFESVNSHGVVADETPVPSVVQFYISGAEMLGRQIVTSFVYQHSQRYEDEESHHPRQVYVLARYQMVE